MNEDITSILAYIKDNLHCFQKTRTPKPLVHDQVSFKIAKN